MENIDLLSLRTLVLFQELGSLERAANRVGRTQAAVSLQLRRLEAQTGTPLFVKKGRRLFLNESGERLLKYAREMVRLNDEALANVRVQLAGKVTLGLPQDLAESWLLPTLQNFRLKNPGVQLNVKVDRNYLLRKAYKDGELDLVILADEGKQTKASPSIPTQMVWVGKDNRWDRERERVRLALFEDPCIFRTIAIQSCKKLDIPFEIVFSSSSLAAIWSAVRAGLGVTVRSSISVPGDLAAVDRLTQRAPKLGTLNFHLEKGVTRNDPAVTSLYNDVSNALLGSRISVDP